MSNWQTEIFNNILYAKRYTVCAGIKLINQEKGGGDLECCELKLMLLINWIDILESYYCDHFSEYGNITPDYECLTLAQAQELLAKVKTFIGV